MILMSLSCLTSWSTIEDNVPSTGKVTGADTSYVSVPISYLREANVKMIERNYYKEMVDAQDSIVKVLKEHDAKNTILLRKEEYKVKKIKKQRNAFIGISIGLSVIGAGLIFK